MSTYAVVFLDVDKLADVDLAASRLGDVADFVAFGNDQLALWRVTKSRHAPTPGRQLMTGEVLQKLSDHISNQRMRDAVEERNPPPDREGGRADPPH